MDQTIAARITLRLRELGTTTFEVDRRAGLSRGFTNDFLNGRKTSSRPQNIAKLASALQVSEAWLMGLDRTPPPAARPEPDAGVVPSSAQRAVPVTHGFEALAAVAPGAWPMPRDLPIYGTANGSAFGAIQVGNDPIDFARRPPALMGVRDAYAIYVSGDSMDPEHRNGDLRVVHPHRPVNIGDTVILQGRIRDSEPVEAFIKILVRRSAERITVRQHNPVGQIEFPTRYVQAMHKVLSVNEMLGI